VTETTNNTTNREVVHMPTTGVRVPVVAESAASGETAQLYGEIRDRFGLGFVPDVFQLTSTRPTFLRVFWDGYRSMFDNGALNRETKELIAALVARDASCQYCVDAHLLLLEVIDASPEVITAARSHTVDDMPVEPRGRELLRLVQRIDHYAYKITDADFAQLRDAGWTDEELLEGVWTACLFNGIVRLADTLGLYRLGQLDEPDTADAM
jgi:uncharacterized peroxidase-related enzyme